MFIVVVGAIREETNEKRKCPVCFPIRLSDEFLRAQCPLKTGFTILHNSEDL